MLQHTSIFPAPRQNRSYHVAPGLLPIHTHSVVGFLRCTNLVVVKWLITFVLIYVSLTTHMRLSKLPVCQPSWIIFLKGNLFSQLHKLNLEQIHLCNPRKLPSVDIHLEVTAAGRTHKHNSSQVEYDVKGRERQGNGLWMRHP